MDNSSTSSRNAAMQAVPAYYGSYANKGIGYGQIDNVVHSGNKLFGKMVYTYALVDMGTHWIIPYATYNKGPRQTKAVYDKPMTPYQRAMECKTISLLTKQRLTEQYESLNPRLLRVKIEELQRVLSKLKCLLGVNYEVHSK